MKSSQAWSIYKNRLAVASFVSCTVLRVEHYVTSSLQRMLAWTSHDVNSFYVAKKTLLQCGCN